MEAKKRGGKVAAGDLPPVPQKGQLSGADIEGIVGRAWRTSLLAGADHVTREALASAVAGFLPSTQGLERELQEVAAVLEWTRRVFPTAAAPQKNHPPGGRGPPPGRLTPLKQTVR